MAIDNINGNGSHVREPLPPANENHASDTPSKTQASDTPASRGVPPEEYTKAATKVGPYLKVQYDDPKVSPTGRTKVRTSRISVPPGERAGNSRATAAGRKADAELRRDVYRTTGMHPGHGHALAHGVDSGDAENVRPQNATQNGPGGTWNNAEVQVNKRMKGDRGLGLEQEVRTRSRIGNEEIPISRKMINHYSDGTVTGENVTYGNFPSPASRAAQERGPLEPGEARRLDREFQQTQKAQQLTPAETEQGQADWRAMRDARQVRKGARPAAGLAESATGDVGKAGHTLRVAEAATEDLGKAGGALGKAGDALGPIGVALSAADLAGAAKQSLDEHSIKPIATETVKQAGGWAGAMAGAEAGAEIGAALGVETGPGAIVTGLVGGVVGGIIGAAGADRAVDWAEKRGGAVLDDVKDGGKAFVGGVADAGKTAVHGVKSAVSWAKSLI